MRRLRRFLGSAAGLFLLGLAVVAALPLWFPWVLSPVLAHFRVQYSGYQRRGFTHFSVNNIEYTYKGTTIKAAHAETLLPTVWLWEQFLTPPSRQEVFVTTRDWQIDIFPEASTNPASVYHSLEQTWPWVDGIRQWAPKGIAQRGKIRFPGEELSVFEARWSHSQVIATVSDALLHQTAQARIALGADWDGRFKLQPSEVEAQIMVRKSATTLNSDLSLLWHGNHAAISAEFARLGLLPGRLTLEAKSFHLPAKQVGLKKYREVTGSASGRWQDGKFQFDLAAGAQPESATNQLTPPLSALFHATGNTNAFRIETAKISFPGVSAELTNALEMTFGGRMINEEAALELKADVSKQPLLPITGQLDGEILLHRKESNVPDIFFDLSGANLVGFGVAPGAANLEGHLIWPWFKINLLNLQFTNHSVVDAKGEVNFQEGTVREGTVRIDGLIAKKFLPPGLDYKTLSLSAELSGPLAALRHSGRLKVGGFALPGFRPMEVSGDWRGQSLTLENFHAAVSPGKSVLTLEGSADRQSVLLNAATLKGGPQNLSLQNPARLSWRRTDTNRAWRIALPTARWRGGASDLTVAGEVQWPEFGDFSVAAHELSLDSFQEFCLAPLPALDVAQLQSSARWSNGPIHFSVEAGARFNPVRNSGLAITNLPFTAEIKATGDDRGVNVSHFDVTAADASIVSAQGSVPVTLDPQGVHFQFDQPLNLQAMTRPNPRFWSELTGRQRFTLEAPSIDLDVAGTLRDPTGTLKLAARRIDLQFATNFPRLNISNLAGDLALSPRLISVNHFEAQVEGQPFTARGGMPMPRRWSDLLDWRKAHGEVRGANIQLAAFTRFAPAILSPQGAVSLDLIATNGHLSGELIITNAVSQPVSMGGAIQSLSADVRMADDKIHLVQCSGLVGGGPVVVTGDIDLGRKDPITALPYFKLEARGEKVPLARTAEMILRTGFAVTLSDEKGGQPVLSGTATLLNSYYLSDPKLLVPGSLAAPENRPPYFSIQTLPFANWRLDLLVAGTKFLQVHSPFFNGVVSANFHLSGSLRVPLALGDVQINSGQIEFPFANLNVTQGNIYLTTASPYLPQLLITASARAYAYDLRMQASGPADQPSFEFTSTPGLSSDQILLMLTTGELPVTVNSFSTEQRASRVGVFVGKNTLSQLGLFPGGEERLTVGAGEAFGELTFPDEVMETYSAEYKLGTNWSLIGEYDPFGVNLGLKWRFYSK
ncbi:MAG TPA: translocation/assembly module TamB domain-containing protein [Candidatus Saccharimonadales bacterium]|nr:translocation/assembly module TamB domain-containing protein [Candidatus Saccharimonadales bacterium]